MCNAKDLVHPIWVAKPGLFNKIHRVSKESHQFNLHLGHIKQADMSVWRKCDQHIHIAIGAKVTAQNRAEQ